VISDPGQVKTIDAARLTEYAKAGSAYDLYELCIRSNVSLEKVALLVVASGLDNLDKLPGYAMTDEVYRVAERRYSEGHFRQQWRRVRVRHNPNYLEAKESREYLKHLATDPDAYRRYHLLLFFQAWAVFWDDAFLKRMINKADSRIIATIPEPLLSEEVCFAAVSRSGNSLRYVPESQRTLPVCMEAVRNDGSAIAFAPARWRDRIRSSI
jgi:hypothetical protein